MRRALRQKPLETGNHNWIDDDGACRLQLIDVFLKDSIDFSEVLRAGFGIQSDGFAQYTDARTFQRVLVEQASVGCRRLPDPESSHRIFGIIPNHGIE